jgi:hypothetical protein
MPEYWDPSVTYSIVLGPADLSSTKKAKVILYCTQAWGDAWDVHSLKLTYQYAVWK